MKYIFDFDDVLFNNTEQFKKHMYACLVDVGISLEKSTQYYQTVRENEFYLLSFISNLFISENATSVKVKDLYKKIMSKCSEFINKDMIELVRTLGKENCFIISNGEKKFQEDKIKESGIAPLFSDIFIVPKSKKEIIYQICEKFNDEQVFFIEDKLLFIEDIDMSKCPNLKTILYTGQKLELSSFL